MKTGVLRMFNFSNLEGDNYTRSFAQIRNQIYMNSSYIVGVMVVPNLYENELAILEQRNIHRNSASTP